MKSCKCGGKMYRHVREVLKTGEEKMRFRCQSCGVFESFYRNGDEWQHQQRNPGRPCADDSMFRVSP